MYIFLYECLLWAASMEYNNLIENGTQSAPGMGPIRPQAAKETLSTFSPLHHYQITALKSWAFVFIIMTLFVQRCSKDLDKFSSRIMLYRSDIFGLANASVLLRLADEK
jgi:hypothetical protein